MDIKLLLDIFVSIIALIIFIGGAGTYLRGQDYSGWAWKCDVWATIAVGYIWMN